MPTINLDFAAGALSPAASEALERSAYGVLVSEDPAPAAAPQALEKPSDDPGPHLSYAIQWILFAAMGFIFIGYVIRTERRHRREDAADAAAAAARGEETTDSATPPATASRRRRDRDADDEDALLDAARR